MILKALSGYNCNLIGTTAIEFIKVHGGILLHIGVRLANGKDVAGALGAVIVDGLAVQVLEAQGNAVGYGDALGSGHRLALDGNANETVEGRLLTASGGTQIG